MIHVPDRSLALPQPFVYGRGMTPQGYKEELRRKHKADNRAKGRFARGIDGYHAAQEIALAFWTLYEQVNRDFLPDDPVYSAIRSGITPVAGNDLFTFLAVASREFRLLELIYGSEATASAAHRIVWQVSTGGATSGGAVTPEKLNTNSPASLYGTTNIVTTWTTQPTLSGNPKFSFGFNELGGFVDWKAAPGEEDTHVNEQISNRNATGTGVVSITDIWEEM